jgi:hypothetical protein
VKSESSSNKFYEVIKNVIKTEIRIGYHIGLRDCQLHGTCFGPGEKHRTRAGHRFTE